MAKEEDHGLLIAALVAIVAVVGLVILFTGAKTGAVPTPMNPTVGQTGLCSCPQGYTPEFTGGHGGLASCTCHKMPQAGSLY